jgi:hypothetical protein
MSGLLSHIAGVVLLLHMLLGCCWHHAHACHHRLLPAPVSPQGDDCDQWAIGGPHHSNGHGSPGDDHHGSDHCQGSWCVFTAGERLTAVSLAVLQETAITVAPTGHMGTAVTAAVPGPGFSNLAGPCPPLRLHLVNQVLLL